MKTDSRQNEKQRLKRWLVTGAVATAVSAVGLWPVRYLASPRWSVQVVNQKGEPLPGISVRLVYKNYSAEARSHEITLKTDANGNVLFEPQYGHACLFQRVFYTASSARAFVHASFGRRAYVFAFGSGYEGGAVTGPFVTDWTGKPAAMQSRIVASRTHG